MNDDELIRRFVETFHVLDGSCWMDHTHPPPPELNAGIDPDDRELIRWRPAAILTEKDALTTLYQRLPGRLPPLYEQLILSWRWLDVHLHRIRLLANPPGNGLEDLTAEIMCDRGLTSHLLPRGYVPFARDMDCYDPVSFDLNGRGPDGDCPIRRFEHEAMLTFGQIGESWQLWPSFRRLMEDTIEQCPGS
jgi:hypothetical protein